MKYIFRKRAFYTSERKRCKGITKLIHRKFGRPPISLGEEGMKGGLRVGRLVDRQIDACVTRGTQPKHRLARAFFNVLKKMELKPVKTQVTCGIGLIATAVDVVCIDKKTREIVLVEQKIGYSNCLPPKGYLKGCLSHIPRTADAVAFVQLALTQHMYETQNACRTRAYYIRMHGKGASVKPLPTEFRRLCETMWNSVSS